MPRSCLNQSTLETLRTTVTANTSAVATASTAATTAAGTTTSLFLSASRTTLYSDEYISVFWDGATANEFQPFFQLSGAWSGWVDAGQLVVQDNGSFSSSVHLDSAYITGSGPSGDLYFSDGGSYNSTLSPTDYGSFGMYWITPETSTSLPSYLVHATYGQASPAGALCINVRRL